MLRSELRIARQSWRRSKHRPCTTSGHSALKRESINDGGELVALGNDVRIAASADAGEVASNLGCSATM
jgi:hypothetical protein